MFNKSPFKSVSALNLDDCDIIFVADMFLEDYAGGAEMTTQALINSSPFDVVKIHAKDLSMEHLQKGVKKYWIFGNFSSLNHELIPSIVTNLDYSVLEYDYKYCAWRSPDKCKENSGVSCSCADSIHGKMISTFLYGAKSLWWMSEAQMEHYHQLFSFLKEKENVVLSSVFDDQYFVLIKSLLEKYHDKKREGWIVLASNSWVKGSQAAITWCQENDKKYEALWDIPYEQVLEKLAGAEGFVYLPQGGDTCPRMVIEAKMLGCDLVLNENVQHKDELWFDTEDPFDTEAYLYAARDRFWGGIKSSMEWLPTLSGYTTILNCEKNNYPWKESIGSMLSFCDEVIVVDGGSTDGTWEQLSSWSELEPKIKAHSSPKDWEDSRFAVFDGELKAVARSFCTGDFCWQQDADECTHENDHDKIKQMIRNFPPYIDIVCLPVVEYWGGPEKVRLDVTPWKWRLSKNKPYITHGIPKTLRRYDDEKKLYAAPGTDGCDYIHHETYESIAHANFYNAEAHNLRVHALGGNSEALKSYQKWYQTNVDLLPSIHHYSWFELKRKIKTYRDYWSRHWLSLYNISQEDTPENNMFFQKPWADVSDDDIDELAERLKEEMGGWIFHKPVDFTKVTPHLSLAMTHPVFVSEYIRCAMSEEINTNDE